MFLLPFILAIAGFNLFSNCSSVDLKSYTITQSVKVYHGQFMPNGTYKMFMGYQEQIILVRYGEQIIYPQVIYDVSNKECLVELFEKGESKYLIVSIFEKVSTEPSISERIYYKWVDDVFVEVESKVVVEETGGCVLLYFNINPGFRHPFVQKKSKLQGNHKYVEYTIAKQFKNLSINQQNDIQYKFGIAYDPLIDIVVGFKIFKSFVDSFDSVKYTYKLVLNRLEFRLGSKTISYHKTKYYCRKIWSANVANSIDYDDFNKFVAHETLSFMDRRGIKFEPIIIDISELISSELFGVEKTLGVLGSWRYTLYQLNENNKELFKIRSVMDLTSDDVVIWVINDSAQDTTVEVYQTADRTIVAVGFTYYSSLGAIREVHMFDRCTESGKVIYKEVFGNEKNELITSLELMGPIALNISIDNAPTSLYRSEIRVDSNGIHKHFYINEPDGHAIDHSEKYVFGNISSKRIYEVGNIPMEKYWNEGLVIARLINKQNIVVPNAVKMAPIQFDSLKFETTHSNCSS